MSTSNLALRQDVVRAYAQEQLGLSGVEIESAKKADRKALADPRSLMTKLFADSSEVRDGFVVNGVDEKGQHIRALLDVIDERETTRTNLESAIVFGATAVLALVGLPFTALGLGLVAAGTDLIPVLRKLARGKGLEGRDKAAGRIGAKHLAASLICGLGGGIVALGAKGYKAVHAVIEGTQTKNVDKKTVFAALKGIVGVHGHGAQNASELQVVAHAPKICEAQ